ncbi:IclR family transcriptional regulator [Bacillus sp. FJAT-27251]|uniref:IclR family transcriptional regulator n=1 Tax=Bacillus sp. FJAT-27251 TaxID=1684142 RepID=UPI0006A79885|nr:IclR family transcriptional regulator [Bacillus sp. FJAT-27251]
MQAIDRAMNIINILASKSTEDWLTITELSKESGLPVSTLHRLLKSLEAHRLIEQEEQTKKYGLGNVWLEYGLQMYDSINFTSHIRSELENLMHVVKESVYYSRPIGHEALIIERIDCEENQIRVIDKIGLRIPLNIGAANKAMVANMPVQQSKIIVDSLIPEGEREAFWETLEETKEAGYGISRGERTEGTTAVAAPVFNHSGEIEGAVSIGCVSFTLTDDRLEFLINHVKETGKRISAKLGYKGH